MFSAPSWDRIDDPRHHRAAVSERSTAPVGWDVHARIISLERKLEELTKAELDRRTEELHRTALLLQQLQQFQQLQQVQSQLAQLQQTAPSSDRGHGLQSPVEREAPASRSAATTARLTITPASSVKRFVGASPASTPAAGSARSASNAGTADASPGTANHDANAPETPKGAVPSGEAASTAPASPSSGQTGSEQTDTHSPKNADAAISVESKAGEPDRYTLRFQDADIREVLRMLGQLLGVNILVRESVQGTVPAANLENVTIKQALEAILHSMGYVYEEEDGFIYVMTESEARARRQAERKIVTKVYRPHYISVADLQALITPILTPDIGKIAVTTPNEVGIETDSVSAGGDRLSQQDALLVQDYETVIADIDRIVEEMDVPPLQVVIEAKILTVRLSDALQFGVNFALLDGPIQTLGVSGNGKVLDAAGAFPNGNDGKDFSNTAALTEFLANSAGLKFGLIRGDVGAFIKALETIADTNLIAAPQVRVINKQKAQLIIGDRLSYKTLAFNGTQTVENVNFLDVGTKLIIRPFISPDGYIRMEVHPERSSASINEQTGLPDQTTTEVTTNVMVRDQQTIVIGGLIEEQVRETYNRVPLLGALPGIGHLFRNKSEQVDRVELIVLLTPRIVHDPEMEREGEGLAYEYQRRQDHFRDHLAAINRRNLARMQRELAEKYLERGELLRARHHIKRALMHNKNDAQALRLRDLIEARILEQYHRLWPWTSASESQSEESSPDDAVAEKDGRPDGDKPDESKKDAETFLPPLPAPAPEK